MDEKMFKKSIAAGVILLMVIAAIAPIVNAEIMKSYANEKNFEEKILGIGNKNPNNPPIIKNPTPKEGEVVKLLDLKVLELFIEDPDGDRINWTIVTSPNIGSNWGVLDPNGSRNCSVSNLIMAKTYWWFVNATDEHGTSTNATFSFQTEEYIPIICHTMVWGLPDDRYHYLLSSLPKLIKINMSIKADDYKVKIKWDSINYETETSMTLAFSYRLREWQLDNPFPPFLFWLDSGDINPDVCPGAFNVFKINIPLKPYDNVTGEQIINLDISDISGPGETKIMALFVNHKLRHDWIMIEINFID